MTQHSACPLCGEKNSSDFAQDKFRNYLRCQTCLLVFVPVHQHLDRLAEKKIYDLHQNTSNDPGYRSFLSRLAIPLLAKLAYPAHGLDFGCGPGPLLAELFMEAGHQVDLYDPIYANHPNYLRQQYDFITCSEVVEHFRQPDVEFANLFRLLKPLGYLGLMTKMVIDAAAFKHWHYKNDLTHICFFSRPCFEYLALHYHCGIEFIGADVIIFKRLD
ncbi:class I SAM-dependent methyltransferase [Methylomonas sp. AM2-LC]|uniref:class I SAM-dependent methyltransferase n=1 Tax=Methylomonas sp. AM2-LC TaxID=3153301 RepID=UPI003265E531